MKKKIYLLSGESRASVYGIGTYLSQLIAILKEVKADFGVIYLHSEYKEVTIEEKNGYQQISIPRINMFSSSHIHSYLRNIVFLLKEFIPQKKDEKLIFHLNFMENSILVVYLKRFFKCKVILTSHYTNWSFNLLGDYERMLKIAQMSSKHLTEQEKRTLKDVKGNASLIKKCDLLICVAQHTVDSFASLNCLGKTPSIVINNALKDHYKKISELEKGELRKKYYIDLKTRVILFAGRLDNVKGVPFLIKAFEETLKENPDSHLLIVGDGSIMQCINAIDHCWSKISFTGRLKKEQLYELYSIVDVGVVCSLHEEFGYVATEMMMHAIPLIVSDTSGLAEIVVDEVTGLKVPIELKNSERGINVVELSKQINRLLEHPNFAQQLGQNARKRFLEKYEVNVFKEKMLAIYNS